MEVQTGEIEVSYSARGIPSYRLEIWHEGLSKHRILKADSEYIIQQKAYGNLPRNKVAQLKGKANVFVGKVRGKSGQEIDGVWQRIPAAKGKPASLKLLVRFEDPHPARQHFDFRKRAEQLIRANWNSEMGKALARAMATAR